MLRVNGRDAVSLLVEQELDIQKFNQEEVNYLRNQVKNYVLFLQQKGFTQDKALELIRYQADQDKKLLLTDDPYADHIWSRGDEVGDLEIDMAAAMSGDFESQSDNEFDSYQSYWERMEFIADKNSDGYAVEVWIKSENKFNEVMQLLNELENKFFGKILSEQELSLLKNIKGKINKLRFGTSIKKGKVTHITGGNDLVFRHWALCFNKINKILGIDKQIVVKELEEAGDALDKAVLAGLNPHFDNMEDSYPGDNNDT